MVRWYFKIVYKLEGVLIVLNTIEWVSNVRHCWLVLRFQENCRGEGKGAKKVSFTACHSGKLQVACTSPRVILTSSNFFLDEQD